MGSVPDAFPDFVVRKENQSDRYRIIQGHTLVSEAKMLYLNALSIKRTDNYYVIVYHEGQ